MVNSATSRRHQQQQQQDAFETMMMSAAAATTTIMPTSTPAAASLGQQHSILNDHSLSTPVDQQQQQQLQLSLNKQTSYQRMQSDSNKTTGGITSNQQQQQQQVEKRYRPQKFCSVCGDKAIACNFNAVTCESCKAFFRRNAYKEQRLKCLFESRCLITKDTRRFCSKCRLLKCFTIGMKREWILTDEQKHSKRVKIIQNKETKQRQLANISVLHHQATTKSPSASSVCSSSHLALGYRYHNQQQQQHRGVMMSSSSPASSGSTIPMHGRSEASSPANTTTTTAKNSLCSSREASISRSDSHDQHHHHHHQQQQHQQQHQQQLLQVASPSSPAAMANLFREARQYVETRDASTSTRPDDEAEFAPLTLMQSSCSWSTQCHFCSMKLISCTNNNNININSSAPTVAPGSDHLVHQQTGKTDFLSQQQQHQLLQLADEPPTDSQVQQLTSAAPRLFYLAVPGGGGGGSSLDGDEHNGGKQAAQLQAASMMAAGSYGASGDLGSSNLLQLTSAGSAASRPVTSFCFSGANAGRMAVAAAATATAPDQNLTHHHHSAVQPLMMNSLNDSTHYNMTGSSSVNYLINDAHNNTITTNNNNNNNSSNSSLLCSPLPSNGVQSNHAAGRHQPPIGYPLAGGNSQMAAASTMIPTCFMQTNPPGLEHFTFPTFSGTNSSAGSGESGTGSYQQPQQQQHCMSVLSGKSSTPVEAYDTEQQQCSDLAPDIGAHDSDSSDNNNKDDSPCSMGLNDNNDSVSSNHTVLAPIHQKIDR